MRFYSFDIEIAKEIPEGTERMPEHQIDKQGLYEIARDLAHWLNLIVVNIDDEWSPWFRDDQFTERERDTLDNAARAVERWNHFIVHGRDMQ